MQNRSRYLPAALLVVGLLGAACSGGDDPTVPAGASAPSPSPVPDPECPLTGLPPANVAYLERPAVGLKIENSPQARPQAGLESADIVFEEIVEGGITRFLAIYHCGSATKAGPVRSARYDDARIGGPFTKLLAFSGANSIVKGHLQSEGMVLVEELTAPPGLFRDPLGSSDVHSLYANTRRLKKDAIRADLEPPTDRVFNFSEETDAKSKKARSVSINFSASNTIEYRWENDSWARYEAGLPFMTEAGEQLTVPNVLIQEVTINHSSTIADVAGNPSPDINLLGTGKAVLFRDGRVVKGRWTIKKEGAGPVFETRAGDLLEFSPGPIWIELVPSPTGTVKGSFSFSKRAPVQ